jgi:hypothetical protein
MIRSSLEDWNSIVAQLSIVNLRMERMQFEDFFNLFAISKLPTQTRKSVGKEAFGGYSPAFEKKHERLAEEAYDVRKSTAR